MKLAFHGATTMTSDLETDIAVSAQAGFSALELWAAKVDRFLETHPVSELKRRLHDAGVQPTNLNSLEFVAFRGAEFAAIQSRLHQMCEIARSVDCPTVVIVPSPTPDRNMPWSGVVAEYVSVLQSLSAIAAPYGVRLSFEFLGYGWCSVRTPRAAWQIVQAAGCDNVGITVDAAHFYGGGGLMAELSALDPARIFAFHLDDLEDVPKEEIGDALRLIPGLGIVPLAEICQRLQSIHYDGPCAVELFRPEYWEWDPLKVAQECHLAATRILAPYFKLE